MTEAPSAPQTWSLGRRVAAWGVHCYTALGLPIAIVAMQACVDRNVELLFGCFVLAVVIDGTDGMMARAAEVKKVVPQFDGALLDNVVDFLMYVFVPAMALIYLDMLPEGYDWVAAAPLMASGYGFCQADAKTPDSYVGFPSYWNAIVGYLYVLSGGPVINAIVLIILSILVFVPIHYVYPTRTLMLRPVTLGLGFSWCAVMLLCAMNLDATWMPTVAKASLAFPAYYTVISAVHHRRVMAREASGTAS